MSLARAGGGRIAYYLIKLLITVVLVVLISELAKRDTLLAGLLASLPIVSFLAMIWLYLDTRDSEQVARLSSSIFWLVLPSLSLFLLLPLLLRNQVNFSLSLALSTLAMIALYLAMLWVLGRADIRL